MTVTNDDYALIVGTARFYTAAVGTPVPDKAALTGNKKTALTGWEELGHTDIEKVFDVKSDGGETTVKGSLQSKALRTIVSPTTWSLTLDMIQFDKKTLKRYLGQNAKEHNGLVYAQSNPQPEKCALLILAEDGANVLVVHGEKVEISKGGDFDIDDTEDFASIPLKFTFLDGEHGSIGMGLHVADK